VTGENIVTIIEDIKSIKTLVGHEDANGKVDPPGMRRSLRVYVAVMLNIL
jgi:hypothetical protein